MRKNLLLMLMAFLLPGFAMAQNNAIQKTIPNSYGQRTDYRLVIPTTAAGIALPQEEGASYAVAEWIKTSSNSTYGGVLMDLGTNNHLNFNGNWNLSRTSAGKLKIGGHGSDNHGVGGASDINYSFPQNEWTYVLLQYNNPAKTFELYINGEKVWDKVLDYEAYYPWADGEFHFGGYGIAALIDEVHIFNRALSADEVKQAFENPLKVNGLTGYYTLNNQQGTGIFANEASNAAEGTDATWTKYYGTGNWGADGIVDTGSGHSNTAASATLVEGREIAAATTYSISVPAEIQGVDYVMFNVGGTMLSNGQSKDGIEAGTAVSVTAAAVSGYVIAGLTVDGVDVTLTKTSADQYTGTFELNSDLNADNIIFTTEKEPVSFYIPADGEVAGIKSFEVYQTTETSSKQLASGMTHQLAPGTELSVNAFIADDNITGLKINGKDTGFPVKVVFGEKAVAGKYIVTESVTAESYEAIGAASSAKCKVYSPNPSEIPGLQQINLINLSDGYQQLTNGLTWEVEPGSIVKFIVAASASSGATAFAINGTEYPLSGTTMIDYTVNEDLTLDSYKLITAQTGTEFYIPADGELEGIATFANGTNYVLPGTSNQVNMQAGQTYYLEPGTKVTFMCDFASGHKVTDLILNGKKLNLRVQQGTWMYGSYTVTDEAVTRDSYEVETPAPTKYAVNVQQPEGGVITLKNGETTVAPGTELEAGTELALSIALESGYTLVNYTLNGQPVDGNTVTVPAEACTISATLSYAPAIDYCTVAGNANWSGGDGRGITSLEVNGTTIQGSGTLKTHAVTTDATSTVITVTPGENLVIKSNGGGEWMHTFIYIDYGQDGWTVNTDTPGLNGDLVWYNQMCPSSKLANPNKTYDYYDINGSRLAERSFPIDGINATITIPADLAPGDYRCRYKVDWAATDPCGNPTQPIANNGGCMIDFTLHVEGPATPTYSITLPESFDNVEYVMFNVAGASLANGQSKDGIEAGTAVSVTAAAVSGYVIAGLTVDGVEVKLTKTDAGQYTGSFELNADLNADNIIFTTEKEPVSFYIPADGEVAGIKSFEVYQTTETSSKQLASGMTHQLAPGTELSINAFIADDKVTGLKINGKDTGFPVKTVFGEKAVAGKYIVTETVTAESYEAILPAAPSTFAVSVEQPEGGVITVMNGETAVESGAELEAGTELTLSIALEKGYTLVNYTLNGQPVEGNTITVPEEACTISATLAAVDYCLPTASLPGISGRYITSLTLNDVTIQGPGNTSRRKVAVDRTDNIVTVKAGESLHVVAAGTGEWMHPFFYIDFEGDGWTVDPEAHTVNGDLVWYYQMCPKSLLKVKDGAATEVFYDMEGNVVSEENCTYAQDFNVTIPADLAPGDYRCRYKVDWAASDPCGNHKQTIQSNAGVIIDFTLRVEEGEPKPETVTLAVPAPADLEGIDDFLVFDDANNGYDPGEVYTLPVGYKINIQIYPDAGYTINGLTINGEAAEYEDYEEFILVQHTLSADITPESFVFDLTAPAQPVAVTLPESFEHVAEATFTAGGKALTAGQANNINPGTEVQVTLTPEAGYNISSLTVGGQAVELTRNDDGTYTGTFTVTEALTAESFVVKTAVAPIKVFIPEDNTITGIERLEIKKNMSTTLTPGETYEYEPGTTLYLYAYMVSGYELEGISINGETVKMTKSVTKPCYQGTYKVGNKDVTLESYVPVFPVVKSVMTINQPEGGVITVKSGDNVIASGSEVEAGTELTLSIELEEGHSFVSYTLNSQPVEGNTVVAPETDFTISANLGGVDYCAPTGNAYWSNGDGRGINSLDVNGTTVQGSGTAKAHAIFTDATETVVTVHPGETLNITSNGSGEWMHTFVYIDFDNNGWNVDVNAHTVNGDLVWYNQMQPANSSTYYDMEGNYMAERSFNIGGVNAAIAIPEDLEPGEYRVRYKVDWASTNPCGNPDAKNQIGANGGCMIDFTLRVEEAPEPEIISTEIFHGDISYEMEGTDQKFEGQDIEAEVNTWSDGDISLTIKDFPAGGVRNTISGLTLSGTELTGSFDLLSIFGGVQLADAVFQGTMTANRLEFTLTGKNARFGNAAVTIKYNGGYGAINAIGADGIDHEAEYYTLQGVRVSSENLATGFYIVRKGNTVTKVYICK